MLAGCPDWPPEFVSRYVTKGYWEGLTIGDILDRSAWHFPDREALVGISPVDGETRDTYAALQRKVNRLALHLLRLGFRPLDRVIMQLPNIPEFLYLYFALHKIGAIPVMCLPAHRYTEIKHVCNQVRARGYAVAATFRGFNYLELGEQIKEAGGVEYVLVAGTEALPGMVVLNELLEDPIEEEYPEDYLAAYRPNPMEVAVFQLSGGTTGLPKIIPRTHNGYLCCSKYSAMVAGFSPYTTYLATTPLAHNFTITSPGIHGAVYFGAKTVLAIQPDPETVFSLVENERVTYVNAVPAVIVSWLNYGGLSKYDLRSLEVVISGGSKLNPEIARLVPEKLGCKLQQTLGMAEGLNVYTRLDDPEEIVFETVGRPLLPDDEIRIVDEEGKEVPPGHVGELWTRGPYTIRGYYQAEEYNRVAFTSDGFYKTGDLVRLVEGGNLVVEGRKKDVINRGGEKISAEEVENLILSHPKVVNTAVVGMPDPVLGERICAYVILQPGASLTLDELKEFLLAKQIAKFKLPERLEVVDAFPLTPVGKVSKKDLRADVAEKLAREGQARTL